MKALHPTFLTKIANLMFKMYLDLALHIKEKYKIERFYIDDPTFCVTDQKQNNLFLGGI